MLRKGTLKILTVEASMIFLAITVKGITAENETAHVQRIVVASENTMATDTQEPVEPETITADETDRLVYSRDWDADEEESTEGKALVMLVVLNRVWSDGFPDSIGEVVFQKNQFSVTMDGGRYYTTSPNEDCYKAMELVKSGWDESEGALYFESCDRASWHSRNLEFLYQVGNHRFYR